MVQTIEAPKGRTTNLFGERTQGFDDPLFPIESPLILLIHHEMHTVVQKAFYSCYFKLFDKYGSG
jgi:hypothetical protein